MGVGAPVAAVAHGATVIEKHFTLSRADGGVDSTFSMEPAELRALVVETGRSRQSDNRSGGADQDTGGTKAFLRSHHHLSRGSQCGGSNPS